MHLPALISDLALILGVAALVTILFQAIRQPVVLGYIVAGIIVGPYTPIPLTVTDLPNVQVLAELGVIFLMFSLGLEFTFRKLMGVGVAAGGTAIVEVVLMVTFGYVTGLLLGWKVIDSLFLGGMLSVSSTTIIIKAFDEMGLKTRRFAEIVFGVLIVEDLVAILLLVALSTAAATQTLFSMDLVYASIRLILVVGSWFLLGYFLIPTFFQRAEKYLKSESLTVLSAGLCLLLAWLATRFHYSSALGAFIMGSILAGTRDSHRIEMLILPLRDLFAAVFFVSVGMLVDPVALKENIGAVIVITFVTIFGKIFSSTVGALLTGQPLRRSIQIGFSLAQIGEFSFIIATLGSNLKVTSDFLYPVAVAVSVITTFTTPFLISMSEWSADTLQRILPQAVTHRLAGYSHWAQSPSQADPDRDRRLRRLVRLLLNGLVVTLIFLSIARFGISYVSGWSILAWIGAMVLSAPFVWGMFFAFRPSDLALRKSKLGPTGLHAFLGQLATVVWLGALSGAFFRTSASLILTLVAASILFFIFYRRLERSYKWFERRFILNLDLKKGVPKHSELASLAPWDLHLTRLKLHANSSLVGKAMRDSQIRSTFGLNIVAIQRGDKGLAAPGADEVLFPMDELLVLGTDDQIDRFREVVEAADICSIKHKELSDYLLDRVLVDENTNFAGRTIRDSGIREKLRGLVVGLERGSFRTINPDPGTTLKPGDILWIVSGLT